MKTVIFKNIKIFTFYFLDEKTNNKYRFLVFVNGFEKMILFKKNHFNIFSINKYFTHTSSR
jgi:hypothetical protein